MKIIISGKKGKLHDAVRRALPAGRDFRVSTVPVGSKLLEMARSTSFDALLFTLNSKEEIQPLRWIRPQNQSLPILAVLGKEDSKLREQLWEEGVSQVVETGGLSTTQIHRKLRENLSAACLKPEGFGRSNVQLRTHLHDIRSVLTAILGNAELAGRKFVLPHKIEAELQDIIEGVNQVEGILRRIERRLKEPGIESVGI